MESLFVLTQEHAGIRRLMRSLLMALSGDTPDHQQQLFDRLQVLLLELHSPKEDELVLRRALRSDVNRRQALRALTHQRQRVLSDLGALTGPIHPRRWELPALFANLSQVLHAEETLLYPSLLSICSDDDLWNISVELDRSLDHVGRREWSRLVQPAPPFSDGASAR